MTFSQYWIRRAMLAAAVVVAGTALLPLNASAQTGWPNRRPIKLIKDANIKSE